MTSRSSWNTFDQAARASLQGQDVVLLLPPPASTCYVCLDRTPARFIPEDSWFSLTKDLGIKCVSRRSYKQGQGLLGVLQPQERNRFEQVVLPHLDGAVNLARWLLRNRADAEDVAQEAMLRAYRFFDQFRGSDARAWLLQIVRNSCYTWLEKNRPLELMTEFDEELHVRASPNPETLALQADECKRLMRGLESLPPRFREVLVLRELEECSYKEIAEITGIPMGTVMSTLSRARERLQHALTAAITEEAS